MLTGSLIRTFALLVFAVASAMAATAVRADDADSTTPDMPLAVATVRSIDGLVADIEAVTEHIGRPGFGQIVRGFLVGVNDLKGIDRSRPIGMMLFAPTDPDSEPRPMLFIPVSSIEEVQQTLAGLGIAQLTAADSPDSYTLTIDRKDLPVRVHAGYAYIVEDERLLASSPPDAAAIAGDVLGSHDVAVALFQAGLPRELLEKANSDLQRDLDRELKRQSSENDAEYRLRTTLVSAVFGALRRLINDFEQVSLGLTYSAEDGRVEAEAILRGGDETELADWFTRLQPAPSRFVAIADRPMPLTVIKSSPVPQVIHDLFADVIELARQEIGRELKEDLAPGVDHPVARLLDAVAATNDQQVADGFIQLINVPTGKMVILGGIRVAEDDRLGSAITDLVPHLAESPDVQSVDASFATLGGVTFHRIRGTRVRKQEERVYGPNPALYVGAGDEAFWFAVGGHGTLDSLSEALTLPGQHNERPHALVQWTAHLTRWIPLMESQSGEKARRIGEIAAGTFDGHEDDRFTLRAGPVDRGLRIRAEWDGGYLRLVGNLLNARDQARRTKDDAPQQ
ncbi:hypothetical protein Mal4_26780 [Maioricimonas rarisocia]|uniref:Uncharacterized protein n=1 Tax=Maioricimonas rarisocia TaxID=2528026 RepID=A0A517Z7C8_9PLAN|nr:hypothetical protein [Maioricimonas rarisocia]QDU38351.1 hypothetical protein Mal4_26780 [Maioricimonas rarisocia]